MAPYTDLTVNVKRNTQMTNATHAFVPGSTYWCRSIGDADCIIVVKVLARTRCTVTCETARGVKTFRVSQYNGVEQIKPWGSYSMAPIVGADRPGNGPVPA